MKFRHVIFTCVFTCVFALLTTLSASALESVLELDPESTSVEFTLDATGHKVHGNFDLIEGRLRFDPAGGAASGEIRIDTRSAETGSKRRDKAMHKKVLESEGNPLLVFRAERLEGVVPETGDGEVALHGILTLLGQDHPMTLQATITADADGLSLTSTFEVPYVEWGLHDPSKLIFRVAKTVSVTVRAEGQLTTSEAGTVPVAE